MNLCSECDLPAKARGFCMQHYNKWHYAANAEAARERSRAWHAANPERAAVQRARRDPEMLRRLAREHYWANREAKIARERERRLLHPEVVAASIAKWQRANPDKIRAKRHRRRARLLGLPALATAASIAARVAYYGGLCWMCGAPADCIDHVKPLSKGGPHIPANLRPSCRPCNSRKRDVWEGVHSSCQ